MKIPPSIRTLLGFARKGGTLLCGEAAVETGLKRRQLSLVIFSVDVPEKRRNNWIKWCEDLELPYLIMGSKEEIGNALGMSPRGIIGIRDSKMAAAIRKNWTMENQVIPDTNGGG